MPRQKQFPVRLTVNFNQSQIEMIDMARTKYGVDRTQFIRWAASLLAGDLTVMLPSPEQSNRAVIQRLAARGFTTKQIADVLDMPWAAVNYYHKAGETGAARTTEDIDPATALGVKIGVYA